MRPAEPHRVVLFGVPVDALTLEQTVAHARRLVREDRPHQHVALNAAKVVALSGDPRLAQVIAACDLVSADGAAVVWASRLLGRRLPERVAGIDLMERLVAQAARDGDAVYFLGGHPQVVQRVAQHYRARHPGLRVVGVQHGYWHDDLQVVERIRAAAPRYLFVGLPSPRKELWLHRHLAALGVPFAMGVGGSFDVVAGVSRRAPRLLQRAGLEWAWRLAQEPRRLWRRYLVGNARFAALLVGEWRRRRTVR